MYLITRLRGALLTLCTLLLACGVLAAPSGGSRLRLNINPVWRFHLGDPAGTPSAVKYDDHAWQLVSLPHTTTVYPADLGGFAKDGRTVGWYRRVINVPAEWRQRKVFLEFQGAMQTTKLWVNGTYVGEYAVSGYDSFSFDITRFLTTGKNVLAIRVDNSINPQIPPDGRRTDYVQFGGLYRDLSLVVTDPLHLTFPWEEKQAGVRLTLPAVSAEQAVVQVESTVRNDAATARTCMLLAEIRDRDGAVVATMRDTQTVPAGKTATFTQRSAPIANPHLWSPDDPYLYTVHTIVQVDGREVDRVQTRLGIRWCVFDKTTGFSLNGKPLKLIGANRHQTWPFIGNAVPNGLHRRDAEQLKAMGVNWVRLSHYPHDPDFLDALDELGLMALEEGPTWMGKGDAAWMANLERSFRSMIRRDRNHPCLIVWNACVNHGDGEPALVQAAGEEDPTRVRGQYDIACPMDFEFPRVSGKGALTIEHTGHTFPTTRGERRVDRYANREYEQARRHWEHINAAYRTPSNSGMAVWCMYDYNTFYNSQENIARHGVCDLFRLPKYSYFWHMSELTSAPMAYVVRIDYGQAAVFSNCERVRLWQDVGQGYQLVGVRNPETGLVLHHPPFRFKVSDSAIALKAEGLIGDAVAATGEWRRPGVPVALTLTADRPTITADGSDLSRIIVTAVDANGTLVDTSTLPVTFSIKGRGQLVGENPVPLRAGEMIILAQSAFQPGEMTITASANGLRSASVTVSTTRVPAGVDMPAKLPASHPTAPTIVTGGNPDVRAEDEAFSFAPKRGVAPGTWVVSDPIMLPASMHDVPLSVLGGEYRVYTSAWTASPGSAGSGDAVYVRVMSPTEHGASATVELQIGAQRVKFTVTSG